LNVDVARVDREWCLAAQSSPWSPKRALFRARLLFLALLALGALAQPAFGATGSPDQRYEAQIVGVDDDDLLSALTSASRTLSRQDAPPATRRVLEKRVQDDIGRLDEVLRSEGFYQGKVDADVGDGPPPISIKLRVNPGPPFLIGDVTVEFAPGGSVAPAPIKPEDIGLRRGDRARSAAIIAATERAITDLGTKAYPFAAVAERRVVVDHASHTVAILLRIDAGAFARFGATEVDGLSQLDEGYVRRRLGWSEGAPFDQSKLDEARRKLVRSGLFASVKVARTSEVDAAGRVPVSVTAIEGPRRSIGGGANYSTDLGPGIKGFWEHRNLFGGAEALNLSTTLTTDKQSVEGRFSKPDFPTGSERLLIDSDITNENLDAFESRAARASVRLEHMLSEQMMLTGGLGFERADIESQGKRDQFSLASTPVLFAYDASDNLLEPTRGHRLDVSATPYFSVAGDELNFAVTRVSEAVYWSPSSDGSIVLATRATLGSLVGAETADVPATKRFYSGGGGSVRGYAFQSVGPLDPRNDPIGGRSLFEFGLEARFRFWGSYGIVPFIDAGNVYDSEFPDFNGELQWGGGIGFRYYTPIGPVRLDVAVPLNRRDGVDDAFQVYISIGQAF